MNKNSQQLFYLFILFCYSILINCRPFEFEAALVYSNIYADWDKTIEYLNKHLQKTPDDIEAYILLGKAYGMKEDYPKMNQAFKKALFFISDSLASHQVFKKDIEYLKDDFWCYAFNKGVDHFENHRLADAGMEFNNCIIIDDTRAEAYINLAIIEESINDFNSAIEHYEKAYALDSSDVNLMVYVGELYNTIGSYQQAINSMDKVLSRQPHLVDAIIQKALAYDFLEKIDKAILYYEKALKLLPNNSDVLYNLGRLYYSSGKYMEAIAQFKNILKNNPNDIETIVLVGDSYFSLGEDIIIELEATANSDSVKISDMKQTEMQRQAKEYFLDAIPYFEKAIQMKINDPDVWNMLAIAYSQAGLKEKAEKISKKEYTFPAHLP